MSLAPDPLEQVLIAQHPARVDRKLGEQPVLRTGQGDRTVRQKYGLLGVVDGQFPLLVATLKCAKVASWN